MNITRTHDADHEVLSLSDVKNHLRITGTDDDDALRLMVAGIREKTETFLGKTLITSTWELKLDCFESIIYLPMSPVQSITSIQYVDTDGNTQSFTDFQVDRQGRLKPSYNNDWPDTRKQFDAVTITYVAGETHAGNVKTDIKLAMLLWVGACEINREDNVIGTTVATIPESARNLLMPYRTIKL